MELGEIHLTTIRLTTSHSQHLNSGKPLDTSFCEWLWSNCSQTEHSLWSFPNLPVTAWRWTIARREDASRVDKRELCKT